MAVRVRQGTDVLTAFASGLDELHAATATPVTARRPWLDVWQRCYADFQPLAVVVEGAGGRLDGAALLAHRRRLSVTDVVAMGHGPSDRIRLPARSLAAAEDLSAAVSDVLRRLPRPWRLTVRHLPQEDAAGDLLLQRLGRAQLVAGDVSPVTRFTQGRQLRTYVSRNHHGQVQRMRNRIRREGLALEIAHLVDAQDVVAALDEVEAVCRCRDVELRGWSALDDGHAGPFFHHVVLAHAARGEVCLTTLRLQGKLAAYVLCFRDGSIYRMWNCRVAPPWKRYGAGRLANDAALAHALADETCVEFDWMRGEEAYKQSMANDVVQARDLMAWSSSALEAMSDGPRRLKVGLVSRSEQYPAIGQALPYLRRVPRLGRMLGRRSA